MLFRSGQLGTALGRRASCEVLKKHRRPRAGEEIRQGLSQVAYCDVAPVGTLPFGLKPVRPDFLPSVNQNVPSLSIETTRRSGSAVAA